MTLVATQVKRRRGTNDENDAFAGAEGEITVDLTNKELRVHDGSGKKGGFRVGHYSYSSNCITEIPQDIKLELSSSGQLKLLAGSKVYIPNGTNTFTPKTFTSDITRVAGIGIACFEIALFNKNTLDFVQTFEIPLTKTCSGTTDTLAGQAQHLWYDTTNNLIKYYGSDGTTNSYYASFPHAIVSGNNSSITSIDQVFNGFGYIGSTIFTFPKVKALIPNGRNADGSLKNIITNTAIVKTVTKTSSYGARLVIDSYGNIDGYGQALYDPDRNVNYNNNGTFSRAIVGKVVFGTGGKITSFELKQPFHAVDYSDTEYIAHQAVPSSKYIDYTLPASGGSLTMPADGYLNIIKIGDTSQFIQINASPITVNKYAPNYNGAIVMINCPVRKGQVVTINYDLSGTTNVCRFIYAEGAK